MSDPVFILLKPPTGWVQESLLYSVLGAVVKDCLKPTDNAFPQKSNAYLKGLNEIGMENFNVTRKQSYKSVGSLACEGFFKLLGAKEDIDNFEVKGKRVSVKRLRRLEDVWKKMATSVPDFSKRIEAWIPKEKDLIGRSKGEAYWVTGVLICQNVTVAAGESEARELQAQGEISLGPWAAIAGQVALPGLMLDPKAFPNVVGDRSKVTSSSKCFGANAKNSYIFGLEVRPVRWKGPKGKEKVESTDKLPKALRKRMLGADSCSDDDSDVSDLDELEAVDMDEAMISKHLAELEQMLDVAKNW